LEKGLIMQPRRATFGAKYIAETVAAFGRATRSGQHDAGELQWANDVLVAYFDCVRLDQEPYRSARAAFLDITNRPAPVQTQSKPYPKRDSRRSSIQFSDFADLCRQRRSTRWYRPDAVPAGLIRQAIDVAVQAPSACNRQPYQVVALLGAQEAQTVCGYAMGTTGFSHQVPALLVIVGDLSKLPFARDRHLIYIDSALMAMQLMLALETVGLSTCPINWPDIESRERRIAKHLKLGGHQRVIMLMAVGYAQADGQIPFSQKLDSSRVLRIIEP
jgi:nitroreductase